VIVSAFVLMGCGHQPPPRILALPDVIARSANSPIARQLRSWEHVEAVYRAAQFREDGGKSLRAFSPTLDSVDRLLRDSLGASPHEALAAWREWREAADKVLRILPRNYNKPYGQDLLHKERVAFDAYCRLVPRDSATCADHSE
jgi:hypothetical protein